MPISNANTPYALIERKIPEWMKSAPKQTRQTLRKAVATALPWLDKARLEKPQIIQQLRSDHALHIAAESDLKAVFHKLRTVESFAAPTLAKAIEHRFGLKLDVRRTYLFNAKKAAAYKRADETGRDVFVVVHEALTRATQSLLHCALQNFEASETKPGGLDEEATFKSVVLDSKVFQLHVPEGKPVAIPPEQFAELVRELDLGGEYQKVISALRAPVPAEPGVDPLFTRLKAAERTSLRLHAHLALLKGHIDADMHTALLQLPDNAQAQYRGSPISCTFLKLWDLELTGIVAIGPDRDAATKTVPVVLYIPDDPVCPLKQYESTAAFTAALRDRLRDASYLKHFERFIPARHLQMFLGKLEDCLNPKSGFLPVGYRPRVADPNARLPLTEGEVLRQMLDQLALQKIERLDNDVKYHAVSTAAADEREFWERLAYFAEKTLQALTVAALFVPALGEAMMGVAAFDLGYEVFEGIDSWAKGDTEQAFGYLFDVLENVVLIAALGAAGQAGGNPAIEHTPVEMPSFIEELDTVNMPDGEPRLWKPDLGPFAHDIVLPADLKPNAFGVYEYQGRTWLTLEDRAYSIRPTDTADAFKVEHPSNPSRYEPTVRHNGAGNWLFETDRPLQWQGMELFRRSGPHNVHFSDTVASRILRITDTHEAVLRRVISENQRLPAQLEDTLRRFWLDEGITQRDPATTFAARGDLFDRMYHYPQSPQSARDALIAHAGPALPLSFRQELLREATEGELQALDQGQVPPRLTAEMDAYRPNLRLTRAYENLYLRSVRSLDTDKLILHTLERLPGWPAQLRIELHDETFSGPLLDSIGPVDAPMSSILSREHNGYRMQQPSSEAEQAVPTLYAAIVEALPEQQRTALGLTSENPAAELEQQVQQAPLMPRKALRELLGIPARQPGFVPPMRLADGRVGYLLSGRGATAGYILRDTLLDTLRLLGIEDHYPMSAENVLRELEARGMTRTQIFSRLQQLLEERQALEQALSNWADQSASLADLPIRTASRSHIAGAIWRHWYSTGLLELSGIEMPFILQQAHLVDFPTQLPGFLYERTRSLQLIDMTLDATGGLASFSLAGLETLQRFLGRFPQLTSLTVSRGPLAAQIAPPFPAVLSVAVQSLPQLRELRLINLQLLPGSTDFAALRSLAHLHTLDLSGSSLLFSDSISLRGLSLRHLLLDRTLLNRWPAWLDAEALENLETLSLRDNRITELPDLLLSQPAEAQRTTQIMLQGNGLLPSHIQRIYLEPPVARRRFDIQLDVAAPLRQQLDQLRVELSQLREMNVQWTHSSSSGVIPSPETIAARARLGLMLTDFWQAYRTGQSALALNLVDVQLEHFPSALPAFFQPSISNLVLTRVTATPEQLNAFLMGFGNLTELQFSGHVQPMTALPAALFNMPRLRGLTLHDQALLIDQSILNSLGDIPGLSMLDLSGNRLDAITQAPPSLTTLHRLYLTDTALQAWPEWVDDLLPLNLLDLDRNQLTTLPEHILDNPPTQMLQTEISLLGNPLDRDTMTRAHISEGFRRSYRFNMDLPEDIQALSPEDDSASEASSSSPYHSHASSPEENPQPSINAWLRGTPAANDAHRRVWQQLENEVSTDNLLALVQRLEQTAPYRNMQTRDGFTDRVWRVLENAAQAPAERQLFNAMAESALVQADGTQTCHDGALLVFNQIELRLFNEQSLQGLVGEERGAGLMRLMRQTFRLETLDAIALERLNGRDQAEVRLAYRLRLAENLDLPVAPSSMLYEATAAVHASELGEVTAQVQQREHGPEFLDYAAHHQAWTEYLRSTYAERFAEVERGYQQQVLAVPDRFPGQALEALSDQYAALEREKTAQEHALIRELTNTLSH